MKLNFVPALPSKDAVKKETIDGFQITCLAHHTELIIMHIDMPLC
jgi:hypothetical protein